MPARADRPAFERRTLPPDAAHLRLRTSRAEAPEGSAGTWSGVPVVYSTRTEIGNVASGWGFLEEIAPGALASHLDEDVVALRDHERGRLLGRNASGTLRMRDSVEGLLADGDLPDTELGRETAVLLEREDLRGMSWAWWPDPAAEEWSFVDYRMPGTDEVVKRELCTVHGVRQLIDVSIVTSPAYEQTSVGLRETRAGALLAERRQRMGDDIDDAARRAREHLERRHRALALRYRLPA